MKPTITYSLISTLLLTNMLIAEEKLDDIVITSATKTSQSLSNVTANVDVITAQELEERHYQSVTEAIHSLSGIDLNSNGGLGQTSQLYLRGFDNNKVLVLIDGIRYNDVSSLSGASLADLMVSDIQQIEVVKGPQSGIWGADASAGVISITTKHAKEGVALSASQEFGSFESAKTEAMLSYKNDRFYLKASHKHTSTNGFSAYAPRGEDLDSLEDDGYTNDTTTLKAGFTITPTNKIDVSHTIIDAETEADPYDSTLYAFNPNGRYNVESKTTLSHINYHHVDSFNELNLFAKKSTFKRYYPDDAFSQHFKGEVNEYGLTSKVPYGKEHFIVWGGDYKQFSDQGTIDRDYDNKALFITNHNAFDGFLGGKTIITESLRHDQYSDFDNTLTGKIGLKHTTGYIKGLTGAINYGTAYNVPTHYHLYDAFSGNPNLNPENTQGYDVSLAYYNLKVSYFNNTIDDMIEYESNYDANGNWIGGNFQNVTGESTLKGFEVSYQKELFEDLLISANYTKLSAKDQEGKPLARRANNQVKLGLDYYGIDRLHVGLQGQYIGERFDRA
ncbi:MAG TPA: TonB-dependent receptor, partial [Campylobacterales bacterium]|nr:TonB-dependent receptor [Campylobacterales bacterium]